MRRAYTVVELLIAAALVALVIGTLFGFLSTTRKMNDAARGSAAVAGALLVEETIASDMRMLGVDPKRAHVFDWGPTGLSFYRTVFVKTEIRLRPIRYTVKRTKHGNLQLVRTELVAGKSNTTTLDAILAGLSWSTTHDTGRTVDYLKINMTVLPEDLPPGPEAEKRGTAQVLLARIPVPVQVVNPELEPTCRLTPEADLLPLPESIN